VKHGYDPGKNAWNIRERGLAFADAAMLDWEGAIVRRDSRKDYGEDRYQALADGRDGKPYVVVFTMRGTRCGSSAFAVPMRKKGKPMAKKPDAFMIDEENPEWTEKTAAEARPFGEVFPTQLATWKKRGRPPVETPKVHIGFRFAADVVEGLRATGRGYNARVEKLLREALAKGRL
jgi:uncharacterized DUF497 family protein/uncharacterized protein (DUF4415 family)